MGHYVHLGDLGATSILGVDVEEFAGALAQRVADRVSREVASAMDVGVNRITTAVGTGIDRFVDSPAGTAVFEKLQSKVDGAVVGAVKNHQAEIAVLGVAALALFLGSSSLASKMGPRGTRTSFMVGAAALALVASGVLAPPEEEPSSSSGKSSLPRKSLPSSRR